MQNSDRTCLVVDSRILKSFVDSFPIEGYRTRIAIDVLPGTFVVPVDKSAKASCGSFTALNAWIDCRMVLNEFGRICSDR